MICATGLTVPRMFDWWTTDTTRVVSSMSVSSALMSSRPSSVSPIHRRVAPVLAQTSCQGTRLAWCSIWVTTIESPGRRTKRGSTESAAKAALAVALEKAYAPRLRLSVAFLVKTTSEAAAPTKAAMADREDS